MPEFRVRIHSLSAAGLVCGDNAEQVRLHCNFDSYKEFNSEFAVFSSRRYVKSASHDSACLESKMQLAVSSML